ncbi:MAG: SGNH/GDSL hydrolase family protein [Firmicutes bacterium]|nr:SGNH/GDSL hydrolase family protein [Bacillota bacterium]
MKKLIPLIIILLIISACFQTPAFFASAQDEGSVIAFGDSITNAYGLSKDESYAKLFADRNNFALTNHAKDGLTSEGLINLLGGVPKEDISNANLVILCIGANDLLSIVTSQFEGINSFEQIAELANLVSLNEFLLSLESAIVNFKVNYEAIIKEIKTHNKNIYSLNVYNPYHGISVGSALFGIPQINVGDFVGEWIEKLNKAIGDINKAEGVITVDIFSAFKDYNGTARLVNAHIDFMQLKFEVDPHPTLKGQEVIYSALLKEYLKNNGNPKNLGLIIGLSAGGGIAIIVVAGLIFAFMRKKRIAKNLNGSEPIQISEE